MAKKRRSNGALHNIVIGGPFPDYSRYCPDCSRDFTQHGGSRFQGKLSEPTANKSWHFLLRYVLFPREKRISTIVYVEVHKPLGEFKRRLFSLRPDPVNEPASSYCTVYGHFAAFFSSGPSFVHSFLWSGKIQETISRKEVEKISFH